MLRCVVSGRQNVCACESLRARVRVFSWLYLELDLEPALPTGEKSNGALEGGSLGPQTLRSLTPCSPLGVSLPPSGKEEACTVYLLLSVWLF